MQQLADQPRRRLRVLSDRSAHRKLWKDDLYPQWRNANCPLSADVLSLVHNGGRLAFHAPEAPPVDRRRLGCRRRNVVSGRSGNPCAVSCGALSIRRYSGWNGTLWRWNVLHKFIAFGSTSGRARPQTAGGPQFGSLRCPFGVRLPLCRVGWTRELFRPNAGRRAHGHGDCPDRLSAGRHALHELGW